MDTLDELLHKFGGLTTKVDDANDYKQTGDDKYESKSVWMKQYEFKDIIVPIHDAIFPK